MSITVAQEHVESFCVELFVLFPVNILHSFELLTTTLNKYI